MPSKQNEDVNALNNVPATGFEDFDTSLSKPTMTATTSAATAVVPVEDSARPSLDWHESKAVPANLKSFLRLVLVQPGSQVADSRQAEPGQWLLTGYEPMDEVDIVPLKWAYGRSYNTGTGTTLITHCSSGDGITGKGNNGTGYGLHACDTCEKAKWTPNPAGGRNIKPPCTDVLIFAVYVVQHGVLAEWRTQSSAMNVGKLVMGTGEQQGWGGFMIRLLKGKVTTSPNAPKPFMVPVFRSVVAKTPEHLQEMQEIMQQARILIGMQPLQETFAIDNDVIEG